MRRSARSPNPCRGRITGSQMPRSSTRRTHCLTRYCAALLVALVAAASATAQPLTSGPGRFIDLVEVNDHDDQVDIVVQFTCSLRYLTHQPASEGKELRVQLQPQGDCGVAPGSLIEGELPPVSGGARILEATRIESDVPGQVTLVFSFRNSERFVLAQGVDPHGLRLRLIDRARGRGKIIVGQSTEAVSNFAINLDSQPKPYSPADIELAHQRLKAPAFVSEVVVDGDKWYRL